MDLHVFRIPIPPPASPLSTFIMPCPSQSARPEHHLKYFENHSSESLVSSNMIPRSPLLKSQLLGLLSRCASFHTASCGHEREPRFPECSWLTCASKAWNMRVPLPVTLFHISSFPVRAGDPLSITARPFWKQGHALL